MAEPVPETLTLALIVIFVGVTLIPALAGRLRMPVIVAEIVFGIAIGKSLLDIVPEAQTITFFSSFGLVYLMFLAGLEVDITAVQRALGKTITIAAFSIAIPFGAGALLAAQAGVHPLVLGTVFSTTSLGLVLPLVKEVDYRRDVMSLLLGSVVLVDIISIFLLAFTLTLIEGSVGAEFFYALAIILVLFLLPWLVNRPGVQQRLRDWLFQRGHFQDHVRFTFALIFLLAAVSQSLGFHTIMGAFIAGLVVSELTPESSRLLEKLESFGYGFFIPLFFIIMGSKVDLPALFGNLDNVTLLASVVVVGIVAKVVGVTAAGRAAGLTGRESLAFGLFHSARLSLIIAAAEIGSSLGLLSPNMFSILVLLAVTSAIVGPSLGRSILRPRHVVVPRERPPVDAAPRAEARGAAQIQD